MRGNGATGDGVMLRKRRGLGQVTLRLVSVPDRVQRLAALGSVVLRAVTDGADGRTLPPGGEAA